MKKVRILIIEDNRFFREGITMMINKQLDLKVVAALENKQEIEPQIRIIQPDVILVDLGRLGKNSLQLANSIKKNFPEIMIIVMDLLPLQEDLILFVKAGVSGFILKDASDEDYIKTIRSVFRGEKVLPPLLMNSLFSQICEIPIGMNELRQNQSVGLTKREKEIIASVALGLTNKEIGYKLHLSPHTIKSHIHNILEKLELQKRIGIANYASSGDV